MSEKPSVAQQPPRVALIVATSQAYGQELLRGVARWLRTHGPWLVNLEQRSLHDAAPPWLHNWDGDGIIFHASQPNLVRLVRKLNLPTVDVYDEQRNFGWPSVPTTIRQSADWRLSISSSGGCETLRFAGCTAVIGRTNA